MAIQYENRHWTSSDGLTLHYRDYAGPPGKLPVLCMHGLSRNARDFHDLAQHLAPQRRVIAPSMRGRGESEYAKDAATYNPLQYVADVEAMLQQEGIERFIAIGTSMGGLMTMLMAAGNADRLGGAVLNDIGPVIHADGLERIKGYIGQTRSFPSWMHAARALQDTQQVAFPEYGIDDWLAMAKRGMTVSQSGRIVFDYDMTIAEPFNQPAGAAPPDLWPAFDALHETPLLVIRGALSDLLSAETVAEMKARNTAMRAVEIPDVGHAPMLDESGALDAIDDFLEQLP